MRMCLGPPRTILHQTLSSDYAAVPWVSRISRPGPCETPCAPDQPLSLESARPAAPI